MSIADIPIEKIDESTLQRLRADEVVEQLRLEYKETIAHASRDEKKELLRDISSFANTAGGDILFGVREDKGKPVEIIGVPMEDPDKVTSQLDEIIRDGLEPRLSGHRIHPIALGSGRHVILVRIPRSYAGPHRVRFQSTPQFWARRTNGKYYLDINELRNAFLLSETAAERIRGFRVDRVSKLLGGEGPVVLGKGPKLIFHLIPIDAFQTGRHVNIQSLKDQANRLGSVCFGSEGNAPNYTRYNLDGFLAVHARDGDPKTPFAYCQWFHNGIVESFEDLQLVSSKGRQLPSYVFEDTLPQSAARFLEVQRQLGIQPPVFAVLTVSDVRDYTMAVEGSYRQTLGRCDPIDRDLLLIPEVMIESFGCEAEVVLRPIIDAVWNAAGYAQSPVKKR